MKLAKRFHKPQSVHCYELAALSWSAIQFK
jgi:hypothetical protein